MIRSAVIAGVLLLSTLTGVAQWQAVRDRRRHLLVLKTDPCIPCNAWRSAYNDARDARLRDSINRHFRMQSFLASARPDLVEKFSVTSYPTYIVLNDDCEELDRVVGFPGPEPLFLQLTDGDNPHAKATAREASPTRPPTSPQRSPEDSPASAVLREMTEANGQLQQERGYLENNVRSLEGDLAREREKAAAQVATMQQQLNDQATQAEAERRRMLEAIARQQAVQKREAEAAQRPPAAVTSSQPPPANISTEIIPPAVGTKPPTSGWVWLIGKAATAAGYALTPELMLAIGTATTIGGWIYGKRQERKRNGAASQPAGFPDVDDAPSIPRDNSEIEQIIGLRQQESREPLHDAFFGILFEDEYRANPDRTVKEAFRNAQDRFNNVAPLSTTQTEVAATTTTTNSKG